ncbi:hypothetical protein Trydic_g9303, partial [Trypoxylus dichotomus]
IIDSFDEIVATCEQQVVELIKDLQTVGLRNIIIALRLTAADLLIGGLEEVKIFKIEGLSEKLDEQCRGTWDLDIHSLRHIPSGFLTNPLYLNMLKSISHSGFNLKVINKWHLYEAVLKLKMDIYSRVKLLDGEEREFVLAKHEEMALIAIFGINRVTRKLERKTQLNFNFTRLGFITIYDKKVPVFLHRTFAEFFVAKWLIKNVGTQDAAYIYELMLKNDKADILNIHSEMFPLHKAILERNIKEIERLVRENVDNLLEVDDLGRSIFHLAIIHYNFVWECDILEFLIKRVRNEGYDIYRRDKIVEWTWIDYLEKCEHLEDDYLYQSFAFVEVYWNYYATHIDKIKYCKDSLSKHFDSSYDNAVCYASINLIRDLLLLRYHQDNGFLEFREICSKSPIKKWKELLKIHLPEENLRGVHLACIYSNAEAVRIYIENRANFNEVDRFNCTPLQYSVVAGHSKIVNMLLQNREISNPFAVTNEGTTILHMSVRTGDVNVTKMLLEQLNINLHSKENPFRRVLVALMRPSMALAKKYGTKRLSTMKEFLNEIDKDMCTPLQLAVGEESVDMVKILLKYADANFGYDAKPLCTAIKCRNIEIVKLLLEHGADPNYIKGGSTPFLVMAIENGDEDIVQILLEHNADPNIQDTLCRELLQFSTPKSKSTIKLLLEVIFYSDTLGHMRNVPLIYAVRERNSKDIVLIFQGSGADPNLGDKLGDIPLHAVIHAENSEMVALEFRKETGKSYMDSGGRTPLTRAPTRGKKNIVQMSLDHGAVVNWLDSWGVAPLNNAVYRNDLEIIEMLLRNGAHVNCVDFVGWTPLVSAIVRKNKDIIRMLLDFQADVNLEDAGGDPPLQRAITTEDLEIIEMLLR